MRKSYVFGLILLSVLASPTLHAEGGFFVFTTEITDATEQIILPAGTLITTAAKENGVSFQLGLSQSTGVSRLYTQSLQYGTTTFLNLEGLRLELEADGSFTVRRASGTNTYSLVVRGIYIT